MWPLHLLHSAHQAGLLVTRMRVQRQMEGHGSVLGTNWAVETGTLPRKCSVSMTQKRVCVQTWTRHFLQTTGKAKKVELGSRKEYFVLTLPGELSQGAACLPQMLQRGDSEAPRSPPITLLRC